MINQSIKEWIGQLVRFGLVGSCFTACDLALCVLWLNYFKLTEIETIIVNFAIFILPSFITHGRVTFRKEGNLFLFVLSAVIALITRLSVITILNNYDIRGFISIFLTYGIVAVLHFLFLKFYVFVKEYYKDKCFNLDNI
ncbi:MAG: hypothetical protein U0M61_07190 [Succinivibrio sp.]|nr:hypothetical protein [Succinivibrio sp.]